MAKKGQQVQLQIEVGTDEEWEKLLQKDGLIVVDVYSEWCGPCLGMQASLKKIKLEIGGDLLQLAVAKSDGITALARFKNKSEPTWMFISARKMINLMFGADAPKLTQVILDELKKEKAQQEGLTTDRTPMEVTEMADEEKVRHEVAESKEKEIKEKEERKKAKELLERRTKECENIITNLPNYGTVLIFPSARDKYKEVLNEIIDEAGLLIQQTEKVTLNEEEIKEMCFFSQVEDEFSPECLDELYNKQALFILLKVKSTAEIEDIDDTILTIVYGSHKKPPGAKESPAEKLIFEIEEEEEVEGKVKKEKVDLMSIWVPPTAEVRATVLRMFFPRITAEFTIAPPPVKPEHIAIVFPLNKRDEVLHVMHQYPNEIMKHGVFSSEIPDATKLIAKSFRQLEKLSPTDRTYSEKLVVQVSKQKSECVFAFAQLEPLYMSPNANEGKIECELFFPEEYEDEGMAVEEEEPQEEPEKTKIISDEEGGTGGIAKPYYVSLKK
ncbi:hypothetical protein ABEB36_011672 [Hypothenemus hampei]|uniref:Uncharacterized protein n=1 Tax=Hypothenemus hampei TaxID=57062 RepID=A0ABD1E9H3_HYPHA